MRKSLILALVCMAICAVSFGAGDPWRIKVVDLDPNGPFDTTGAVSITDAMIDSAVGTWGTNGGTFRAYGYGTTDFGSTGTGTTAATYNASTGALTFGAGTATIVEDGFWGPNANLLIWVAMKDGSTYKMWKRDGTYTGHEMHYASGTDGANFGIATFCTVHGATDTNTGTYGFPGLMKTTGGVYIGFHRNSGCYIQNAGSTGSMTSAEGTTLWYDTDTGYPDPILTAYYGWQSTCETGGFDPLIDPHTAGADAESMHNQGKSTVGCDGNILLWTGQFPSYDYAFAPYSDTYGGNGMPLIVGTTGDQTAGGDSYIFIADADNENTQGIGASLLTAKGNNGLSGPSLRARMNGWWCGYMSAPLPLQSAITTPSSSFVNFYYAAWDTDDSDATGRTYDVSGVGRANINITKNAADLNFDGTVNSGDIGPFSGAYGSISGDEAYLPEADLNGDGKVNSGDIGGLSGRYGSDCSYTE